MLNTKSITTQTDQNPLLFSQTDISVESGNNMQADNILRKARMMLYSQRKMNPRAMNLIQMAETALKNGNPVSANDFAGKVLTMLSIKETSDTAKKLEPLTKLHMGKQMEQTISKRKQKEHVYQDVSNDPGVSFSYPGNLTGPESFLAVPAHEHEHARSSLQDAILNGENVKVYVSYRVRYDPSTGDPYMAGGLTRTIRFHDVSLPEKGNKVDTYA